ncbi:MAG: hypothetical protein HFE59_09030 [Clostridiales bacterium]|nr:hypothetical protein [Clostridiales bacterium]
MTNNIVGGIAKAIFNEFGKDTVIYSEEVKQGFKYPCFSITLLKASSEKGIGGRVKYINSYVIRYFPKEKLKNKDMNSILKRLFKCLEFIDAKRVIRGCDMRSDKSSAVNINSLSSEYESGDGVLNFFVNYNFHEVSLETNELMRSLKAVNGKGGDYYGK